MCVLIVNRIINFMNVVHFCNRNFSYIYESKTLVSQSELAFKQLYWQVAKSNAASMSMV